MAYIVGVPLLSPSAFSENGHFFNSSSSQGLLQKA